MSYRILKITVIIPLPENRDPEKCDDKLRKI